MPSSSRLPDHVRRWLDSFRHTHGRAPRILHVGNIANNAYNNAKMLNRAGFDCDVICYDYYHIMGCPEWEDADFRGEVGDHFAPDFSRVDLRGFRRPPWFAQGPMRIAIRYLLARRRGRRLRAWYEWRVLTMRRTLHATGRRGLGQVLLTGPRTAKARTTHAARSALAAIYRARTRLSSAASLVREGCVVLADGVDTWAHELPARAERVRRRRMSRLLPPPLRRAIGAVLQVVSRSLIGLSDLVVTPPRKRRPRSERSEAESEDGYSFDERVRELIAEYDRRFPDRADRLTPADMESYRVVIGNWRRLFALYDLVEAYSTDTILPMVAGFKPYIAYEHGTIREIPFEPTPVGRLTALSYAAADATVITNPDCEQSARRLGVRTRRAIPHLIDHKYYDPALGAGEDPVSGVRPPYIFCPARHDWSVKGTNILIDAFASLHRERPHVQLVTASWGLDLERSRELIRRHGIEDAVLFAEPLHIHDLIRVARGAEVIVDQFRYGVFGGIGPTALAVGTPLVTHLDHSKSAWCMEEPPYFEAHDAESCHLAMRAALDADKAALAESLRRWMERNYWYEDVATRHAELYMNALTGRDRPAETSEPLVMTSIDMGEAVHRYETRAT